MCPKSDATEMREVARAGCPVRSLRRPRVVTRDDRGPRDASLAPQVRERRPSSPRRGVRVRRARCPLKHGLAGDGSPEGSARLRCSPLASRSHAPPHGDVLLPHGALQAHAAHITRWPVLLRAKGSAGPWRPAGCSTGFPCACTAPICDLLHTARHGAGQRTSAWPVRTAPREPPQRARWLLGGPPCTAPTQPAPGMGARWWARRPGSAPRGERRHGWRKGAMWVGAVCAAVSTADPSTPFPWLCSVSVRPATHTPATCCGGPLRPRWWALRLARIQWINKRRHTGACAASGS
jgi:hypothetical protein